MFAVAFNHASNNLLQPCWRYYKWRPWFVRLGQQLMLLIFGSYGPNLVIIWFTWGPPAPGPRHTYASYVGADKVIITFLKAAIL